MRRSLAILCAFLALSAQAVTFEQPLADAAQEQQARAIFHELRCVVCEGQALSESDAPLAIDMRREIRRMVGEGKSRQQVLDYFRARYGEQILLTPPFEPATWALWLAPALLLIGGWQVLKRATKGGAA